MRRITIILTLVFTFNFVVAFAHKDRIERPKTYQFVFHNQDTITLNNPSDSLLKTYSDDIVNGKIELLSAELSFATGETLIFKNDGKKWTEIKITDGKNVINIADSTIDKVSEIHFATVALLWDGNDKRAFRASYFFIQFDMGIEKSFNQYPYLVLSFANKEFRKATIWRQVSESSKQHADY